MDDEITITMEDISNPALPSNTPFPPIPPNGHIPRPPNSWILYRSDISMILTAFNPNPDAPKSQADISKIISTLWRNASPAIKEAYEHRAELKKLEHLHKYPGWRFMPKSKATKEQEKEEKKRLNAGKRKGAKRQTPPRSAPRNKMAHATHPLPPSLPHPLPYPLASNSPLVDDGPGGYSPPRSAANSPGFLNGENCPELTQDTARSASVTPPMEDSGVIDPALTVQTASNGYSHYRASSQGSEGAQAPSQFEQPRANATSYYRTTSRKSRTPVPPPYKVARQLHQEEQQQAYQLPTDQQEDYGSAMAQQLSIQAQTYNTPTPQEIQNPYDNAELDRLNATFSFNLNPITSQTMDAWTQQNPEYYPTFDGFLNNSFEMQMNNTNTQNNLGEEPVGPLEVELGQLSGAFLNEGYDFSGLMIPQWDLPMDAQSYSFGDNVAGPSSTGPSSYDAGADYPSSTPSYTPSYNAGVDYTSSTPSSLEQSDDFDKYLSYEPSFDYVPEAPAPVIEVPTPYVPPAGAAYTSTRRVAGSWNASFASNDIDA